MIDINLMLDYIAKTMVENKDYTKSGKLQALFYLTEAYGLGFLNKRLTGAQFKAGRYGPENEQVAKRLRYDHLLLGDDKFTKKIIRSDNFDEISSLVKKHVDRIVKTHKRYTWGDLSKLLMDSDPYVEARRFRPHEFDTKINTYSIKKYYQELPRFEE